MWQPLLQSIQSGDTRAIARAISFIENEVDGTEALLQSLPINDNIGITGITGPPGAGKSTLVDALIQRFVNDGKRVAVLCVDPSSPFNSGALLGDRIRMNQWSSNKSVYIRSLAAKGSLGGLHPAILEITDLLKVAPFDHIIIETVGVGQSEVEIAGLSDSTVVVLVPEAGDEIQNMKSGLMEVADIFVVNKSDRPGSETFINTLKSNIQPPFREGFEHLSVIRTVASSNEGIDELYEVLMSKIPGNNNQQRKMKLLADRAFHLIQKKRMKGIAKEDLFEAINRCWQPDFNLYKFIADY